MQKVPIKNTEWQFLEGVIPFSLDSIIEEVSQYNSEWQIDTSRQDNNLTHKGTEMYALRFMSYDWNPGEKKEFYDVNSLKNKNLQNVLFDFFEKQYSGKVVRAEIVKMPKNHKIRKHVDGNNFLNIARRVHIPLITNDKVLFTVLNKTINMKVGNWYEINNILPHSVENNSNLDRVHLILDILVGDK